jgi:hypothetical protein
VGRLSLAGVGARRPAGGWRRAELLVPCAYLLLAVALTWRIWSNPAVRVPSSGSRGESDIYLNIWFMRYAATALAHGHLPALVTTAVNAPRGINMMWNTSLLLPGIVLAPVTLLAGPTVSLAVLQTAGFAGSAGALYLVLRRWGASIGAAAVGGALYGFSPALMVAAQDHYHLQFAVLPPLIVDAALRLATGRARPVRTGAWLGLLVGAQIFIAEELLVDTAIVTALALVVLVVSRPSAVRDRLAATAAGVGIALAVALVISGHALWVQFHGPLTETGSPWPVTRYGTHPADFVTAPSAVLFHGRFGQFLLRTRQQPMETFAYLGWPLLIAVPVAVIACWRDLRIRVAGVIFGVLEWLGLGSNAITIAGWRVPSLLLPGHWFESVHALSQVLPNRFPILADGAAAVVLTFAIDRVLAAARVRQAWRRPAVALPVVAAAVAAVLLPVIPRPVLASDVLPAPAGWKSALTGLHLRPGAAVLVLPIAPQLADRAVAMEWQAMSGVPVSLVGGYCIVRAPDGHAVMCDGRQVLNPAQHTTLTRINWLARGELGRPGPSHPAMAAAISTWRPAAVVTAAGRDSRLGRYLIGFFGPPAVQRGRMLGWRVPARLLHSQPPSHIQAEDGASPARLFPSPRPADLIWPAFGERGFRS